MKIKLDGSKVGKTFRLTPPTLKKRLVEETLIAAFIFNMTSKKISPRSILQ